MPGLDPEYKTTAFFQMYLHEKNIVLYSGQYGIILRNRVKNKLQPLFPDVVCFRKEKDVWARGKKTAFLRHGENLMLQQHFFVVVLSDALNQAF